MPKEKPSEEDEKSKVEEKPKKKKREQKPAFTLQLEEGEIA